MDLKIELRSLLGLHEATVKLEHAVRPTDHVSSNWIAFSPSRFIYAYFTFNSIYAYDWERSFKEDTPQKWEPKADGKWRTEREKFTGVIHFYFDTLGSNTPELLSQQLMQNLELLGISEPDKELKKINALNETNKVKKLREKFPKNFTKLLNPKSVSLLGYRDTLLEILSFIYAVRNNIFHGSKTTIHMQDQDQQQRLLIYCAVLMSTNALLFECIEKKDINWQKVTVHLPTKE